MQDMELQLFLFYNRASRIAMRADKIVGSWGIEHPAVQLELGIHHENNWNSLFFVGKVVAAEHRTKNVVTFSSLPAISCRSYQ
jgi:hypothetical protein